MHDCASTLLLAMDRLAEIPFWRSLVAENIGMAGIERLCQDSLLWAVNSAVELPVLCSSDKRVPTAERIAGRKKTNEKIVDLVLFPRTSTASHDWWRIWELHKPSVIPGVLSERCCAYVEIKPANPEGFLSYNGRQLGAAVDADVNALRAANRLLVTQGRREKEILVLLLFLACYPLKGDPALPGNLDAEEQLALCERSFWNATISLQESCRIADRWLLRAERHPSDPRRLTWLKGVVVSAKEVRGED